MALKKIEEDVFLSRFKEFTEASRFIESFEEYSEDDVLAAIDYMIVHKEYHYLLRNVLEQCEKEGIEKIASYLFARLDCLRRDEDKELLRKLLFCQNRSVQESVFAYILSCCEYFDVQKMAEGYALSVEELKLLIEYGPCESVRRYASVLHDELFERLRILEEFFELYYKESGDE